MKKIYIIISACLAFIIIGTIPAINAFSGGYKAVNFGNNLEKTFNAVFSQGVSIKSINDGRTYLISQPNAQRLFDVLSYSKHIVRNTEGIEDKESVFIDIFGEAVIEVVNFDKENDIGYVRITMNGEEAGDWFSVTSLRFYEQISEITDEDGYYTPNKMIGK